MTVTGSHHCLRSWKAGPRWSSAPSTRLRGVTPPAAAESGQLTISGEARAVLERLQAALGDFDLTAASSALADLDRVGMPGNAGDLVGLRNHIDSYEYRGGAGCWSTGLLERVGSRAS